jgi:hypothetical protein
MPVNMHASQAQKFVSDQRAADSSLTTPKLKDGWGPVRPG